MRFSNTHGIEVDDRVRLVKIPSETYFQDHFRHLRLRQHARGRVESIGKNGSYYVVFDKTSKVTNQPVAMNLPQRFLEKISKNKGCK